jgi:isochorismate hydrolase
MTFQKGDLVRVIKAPDQDNAVMKDILNKLGIIVGKVEAFSSKNIWKVFVGGRVRHLHKLDLETVNVSPRIQDNR